MLFSSQLWHRGSHCYANTLGNKECSIRLLTVCHQRNPKSVFKYSLGQQNNIATTLSRDLPHPFVPAFEHVRTSYNLQIMTNIFKWSHITPGWLTCTRFIWLPSKLGLNLDLVLGSPSANRPRLATQSLLSFEPVLVERYFHFQTSVWLFPQHHVYLQMFQLCKLRDNDFDEFCLSAVQCLCCLQYNALKFCKFFVLAMFAGTLCAISTKIHLQYVQLFSNSFYCKYQLMNSIQGVVMLLSISWSVN